VTRRVIAGRYELLAEIGSGGMGAHQRCLREASHD
jgi:hypothetical protein